MTTNVVAYNGVVYIDDDVAYNGVVYTDDADA